MKTIQYRFEGFEGTYQAEEWCLESQIAETRYRLGIPLWIDHKIIKDAHTEPHPELATYISNVCNSSKPAVVPKTARKRKAKPKTSNVSPMLVTLDDTNPVNLVPEILRDRMGGSTPTIPNGLD